MSNEKLLVIGACGFIGSNFIRKSIYNKYPYSLVGLDRISYKNSVGNIYQNPKYKFYCNDFTDSHSLRLILELEKPTKILFAAQPTYHFQNYFYNDDLKIFFDVISEIQSEKKYQLLFLTDDSVWAPEVYKKYINDNLNFSLCFIPQLFGPRQNYKSFLPSCLQSQKQKKHSYIKKFPEKNWMFIDDLCSGINLLFQEWNKNRNCYLDSNWNLSELEMAKEIGILLDDLSWFTSSSVELVYNQEWAASNLQKISWPAHEKFQICLSKTLDWYQKNQWFTNSFGELYQ